MSLRRIHGVAQEVGASDCSSREAATQESPARQCRETKWNRAESRQGRRRVVTQSQESHATAGKMPALQGI
jgi:hypothetical protein